MSYELSIKCNECGRTVYGQDWLSGGLCSKCSMEYDKNTDELRRCRKLLHSLNPDKECICYKCVSYYKANDSKPDYRYFLHFNNDTPVGFATISSTISIIWQMVGKRAWQDFFKRNKVSIVDSIDDKVIWNGKSTIKIIDP